MVDDRFAEPRCADDTSGANEPSVANDAVIDRLAELGRLTEHVAPAAGLVARLSLRLDERALQRQTAWVLVAAAFVAVAGIAFWRLADARLANALVTSVGEWDGVEP